ncbi:hypothetical protein FRC00_001291, partial [Tulasnella sp. 408]
MSRATRNFETQFASLIKMLDQLSDYEVAWDRVKFRGESPVGSGGFGDVRRATLDDPDSSDLVAVKTLRSHGSKTDRARVAVRLAREIHIMSKVCHPNIIPLTGFYLDWTDFRTACVIAPYMANGNVGEYLDDNDVDIEQRLRFALETGRGLLYLHSLERPICHADIKPENILVTDDLHVVICDFGISRIMSESNRFTTTSSAKGSTVYMSPELFSEDPLSTLKSDVWAWGCLVLKITSGTGPYSKLPSQQAIMGHISQGIKPAPIRLIMTEVPYLLHLLHACWRFEPTQRPDMTDERHELPAISALPCLSRYRMDRNDVDQLGEKVGRGGHADLMAGRVLLHVQGSQAIEKNVVIKAVRDVDGGNESLMTFAWEIGLLSQISHPNIITLLGFIEELHNGIAWMIVPRAIHGNVRKFLQSAAWALQHRISLLWDIATGVEYLHTYRPPIIHGDLKSLNVIVNEEGHAEIIDFGSARFAEYLDDEPTFSLRWASPEILAENSISLASDIWALGWTFWEILTGKLPHENDYKESRIIAKVVTETASKWIGADDLQIQSLRDLLLDCWQTDPKQRPKAS